MLIMMYAHARMSGDGALLARYVRNTRSIVSLHLSLTRTFQYNLTKKWADYLVDNALTPHDQ